MIGSSFFNRKKRIQELGSEFAIEQTLEKAFEINDLELKNVLPVKDMSVGEGWQIVSELIRMQDQKSRDVIYTSASDPVKNKMDIIANYAISWVISKLLKLVEDSKTQVKRLGEQRTQLSKEEIEHDRPGSER